MPTTISGTSGVDKIVDSTVTTSDIADGAVTQAKVASDLLPLGIGQTWKNVTGSRASGTPWTNSGSRTVFVIIRAQNNGVASWSLNGTAMFSSASTEFLTVYTPVKPGESVTFGTAFSLWMELS